MDRYVKHIKRKLESDDERLRSNASKIKCQPTGTVSNWFYLSGGLVENAESTTADDGATTTGPFLVELCPWPRSPATPQKLPVSPMSTATKMESPECKYSRVIYLFQRPNGCICISNENESVFECTYCMNVLSVVCWSN